MAAPFHIAADLSEDYHPSFLKALDDLFCDRTLSDLALRKRAHEHLAILDHPEFAGYNSPSWMTRQWSAHISPPTTQRIFLGLYETADEFNTKDSARFVSAGICACALVAQNKCGWHQPLHAESPDERMAQALHDLARDWLVDLLTPFMLPRANRPEDKEVWRSMQDVLQYRDGKCSMCARTSCQGRKARCVKYACYIRTKKACTAAIFRRSIMEDNEPHTIGCRAYGTLRRYCNFSGTSLDVYSQQNTFLLHDPALWSFRNFLWCLKATVVPNQYDVVVLTRDRRFLDESWSVEQVKWKTAAETVRAPGSDGRAFDVPNPALLRVHAMVATVLDRSGSRDLIVNPRWMMVRGLHAPLGPYASNSGRDVDTLYAFEKRAPCPLWKRVVMLPGRLLSCARSGEHRVDRRAPQTFNGASGAGAEDADPPPAYTPWHPTNSSAHEKVQASGPKAHNVV